MSAQPQSLNEFKETKTNSSKLQGQPDAEIANAKTNISTNTLTITIIDYDIKYFDELMNIYKDIWRSRVNSEEFLKETLHSPQSNWYCILAVVPSCLDPEKFKVVGYLMYEINNYYSCNSQTEGGEYTGIESYLPMNNDENNNENNKHEKKEEDHTNSNYFYISNIGVTPALSRRGIGQLLMDEAISRAHQHQNLNMYLHVSTTNVPAIKLYQTNKFMIDKEKRIPNYYCDDNCKINHSIKGHHDNKNECLNGKHHAHLMVRNYHS